ncbi:unnamed protein product [Mortierella alpina]
MCAQQLTRDVISACVKRSVDTRREGGAVKATTRLEKYLRQPRSTATPSWISLPAISVMSPEQGLELGKRGVQDVALIHYQSATTLPTRPLIAARSEITGTYRFFIPRLLLKCLAFQQVVHHQAQARKEAEAEPPSAQLVPHAYR